MKRFGSTKSSYWRGILLACPATLLLLLALQTPLGGATGFNLVYRGDWPSVLRTDGDWGRGVQSAHLYDESRDCLVRADSTCFRVFQFNGKTWTQRDTIPSASSGDTSDVSAWTVGDLGGKGQDAVIAVAGKTLGIYSRKGSKFGCTRYRLPYFVDDVKVGDVNNDGHNELVMLTYQRLFPDSEGSFHYHVVTARVTGDSFTELWNDSARLGVIRDEECGSDRLVCVADVKGVGRNQLLCARGQSDVSATVYVVFNWQKGRLTAAGEFLITDTLLSGAETRSVPAPPFAPTPMLVESDSGWNDGSPEGPVMGDWIPVEFNGGSAFLVPWFGYATCKLARIAHDTFQVLDTLPDRDDFLYVRAYWLDPDGQGKGILRAPCETWPPNSPGQPFDFYRQKSN
jgi:hypothetical protein